MPFQMLMADQKVFRGSKGLGSQERAGRATQQMSRPQQLLRLPLSHITQHQQPEYLPFLL